MLSLITIPKPFAGDIAIIQRNALWSWRRVLPDAEVFVCGDEPGAREAAGEIGARFVPDVERNEFGTPLLGSTFRHVAARSRFDLLAFANADVMLLPDFPEALRRVDLRAFLMVTRRWNVDVDAPIDFAVRGWDASLRAQVRSRGQLYRHDAIDLFVFPRDGRLLDLPPFAVGRPGWDNFFIYRARSLGIPVVDATEAMTLVHQNHGYGHVPGRTGGRWEGPEAIRNRALMGGTERFFDLRDATHLLGPEGRLRRPTGLRHALRTLETAHVRTPWLAPVGKLGFALSGVRPLAQRAIAALTGRRTP